MGAVDRGSSLIHHDSLLVGTPDVPRSKNRLPTRFHSPRRGKDIIPTVALVKFRAFQRGATRKVVTLDDVPEIILHLGAAVIEPQKGEGILDPGAALCPGIHKVDLAFLIPDRAGIDKALASFDQRGSRPWALRIRGGDHINSKIGIRVINPVFAVVKSEGGSPHTAAMPGHGKILLRYKSGQCMTNQVPVHQILGVQHRESRNMIETRCRHPVIIADPDGIGIRVVGLENGVFVGAVAQVGHPWSSGRFSHCLL